MRAVVPLNVAGLRVSSADDSGLTSGFAGRTATFDKLPHTIGLPQTSTGDQIWRGLDLPAAESLAPGIHLHWELPEYFKRGNHDPDTGAITFPAAPNRWLVSRTLRIWDTTAHAWGPVQAAAWVVESDYLTAQPPAPDSHGVTRLTVAVPLQAPGSSTPYLYMGRVLDAAGWNPASTPTSSYLPAYTGADHQPLQLTSIGFTGAAFSGYYPDCRTVFGFWDTFEDVSTVFRAIADGDAVTFAASYAVTGWLQDPAQDPMTGFGATVTTAYDTYVAQCHRERVPVDRTPSQVFCDLAQRSFGWLFTGDAVSATLNNDQTIATLTAPDGTLCAGTLGDVVWNGPGPFLAPPPQTTGWSDQVSIAAGNTTIEAVAALVASQLPPPQQGATDPQIIETYESLLEALQLGVLRDLESDGNALVALGRARHDRGFSSVDAGHTWTVQSTANPGQPSSTAVTLPLVLAEQLAVLNQAQQAYDRARAAVLTAREQLFMDWLVYVRDLVAKAPFANALSGFLTASATGELKAVQAADAAAGLVDYQIDPATKAIIKITTSSPPGTRAATLVAAYQTVAAALAALVPAGQPPAWELDAVPASPFWMPTDPVLVMEGNRIEPARRNGADTTIAVRTDAQLISRLAITGGAGSWTIDASSLTALPPVSPAVPAEVAATLAEAALLDPQRSSQLAGLAGSGAPAALAADLGAAVGGQSPLDPPVSGGLYAAVQTATAPVANPVQTVGSGGGQVSVTFTRSSGTAYTPVGVGWNTQAALPEFAAQRFDPYLPVWMCWSGSLDPLAPRGAPAGTYAASTVTSQFTLDPDTLDFDYPVPAQFTTGTPIAYAGEVVLSKQPMTGLVQQIDGYLAEFAQDPADPELLAARADLANRRVMSQALDTFNLTQTLRSTIPRLPVMDLTVSLDIPTRQIAAAANPTGAPSWYATGFNTLQPVTTGPQALGNFGPLRAGFLELQTLALVDVFGQRLSLDTATHTPDGALAVSPSGPLTPAPGDTANAAKLYLPPRVLTPTRPDAQWLSAAFDPSVPGIDGDVLEAGDHPASSPVCGWLMPNHLDLSLMCYDADGRPIGSFIRVGTTLRYQTTAGNLANPTSDLAADIGPRPGTSGGAAPAVGVNPHLAALMWFIDGQHGAFLTDLLATVDASTSFIAPSHAAQDVSLSILLGRPLAVVRMSIAASTAGGTLPVNQSLAGLQQAVAGTWTTYAQRQANASAGLGDVVFDLTVGDHTDLDDGLVAYLPENGEPVPYTVIYSDAAPAAGDSVLRRPAADTVQVCVAAANQLFTALVDPRAPVHLTSGVLPTAALQIPPDQYASALQRLGVTFTTRPVVADQLGVRLPLPVEPGYLWSWVAPGAAPVPLPPTSQPETPVYGHGPQTLTDGWLLLQPDPEAGR